MALAALAEAQKQGDVVAFIDVDHALDPRYCAHVGINLDEMLVSQPATGEEALSILEILAKSKALGMIVVDTVAGLVPQAELEQWANPRDEDV